MILISRLIAQALMNESLFSEAAMLQYLQET